MKKNEVFICTGGELPDIWSIEKSTQGVRGQKTGRNGKVAARGRKTPKALAFKPKRSKAPFMTNILLRSFTTLK